MKDNRDLNPTPEARMAMAVYHDEYAAQRLGSMGFWDTLSLGQQRTCEELVGLIIEASQKHGRLALGAPPDADVAKRCSEIHIGSQISEAGQCALAAGHAGDHVRTAPSTSRDSGVSDWQTAALLKDRTRQAIRDRCQAGEAHTEVAQDYGVPEAFVTQLVAWQIGGDEPSRSTPAPPTQFLIARLANLVPGAWRLANAGLHVQEAGRDV